MILLSDERLNNVPILPEYKLHMESDMQVDLLWTVPRTAVRIDGSGVSIGGGLTDGVPGPTGAGLLIEMPGANCNSPGVSGPPLTWRVSVVAFEERNVNWTPISGNSGGGTFILAETLALIVLAVLHNQAMVGIGNIYTINSLPIAPAQDWMALKPGIIAYRVTLQGTAARPQWQRSAVVTQALNLQPDGTYIATLTCPDSTAEIRFTLDGSPPVVANPASIIYDPSNPPTVLSGQSILSASSRPGYLLSAIGGITAT